MKPIAFRHSRSLPSEKSLDRHHTVILLVPGEKGDEWWKGVPYGQRMLAQLKRRGAHCQAGDVECFDLPNAAATRVVLVFAPIRHNAFQRLTLARKVSGLAVTKTVKTLPILSRLAQTEGTQFCDAITCAVLARCAELPSYKSDNSPSPSLRTLHYYGVSKRVDTPRLLAEATGNELARRLTVQPANKLTPALYKREIARLAKQQDWRMRFLDTVQLKRKRAGAFLAVVQGSATRDAGIVQLSYRPPNATGKAVALVGKGICFDTGGVNLKNARYMQNMHEDMEGSAVALGTLLALTQLRVDFPVDCWLALAQNHVGPEAYKPSDVVTAVNGTSIEVVHTDAEGRMVLADTLALAARGKPKLIIDYATLTGTCVHSLSSRYSGVFTNREPLQQPLIEAGRASGERVWPFPTDEDFDEALDSGIADVKQCALNDEADHIVAARFLRRFVDDTPWVHVDLAAGRHRGGLAHIPTDTTGFGVRFTLELLLGDYLHRL